MMSNMSYCRFENTLPDMQDCVGALESISDISELSDTERRAAKEMMETATYMVELLESLDG